MNYIKVNSDSTTVYPYELWSLQKDFPNTSFPQPYETATLSDFGVFPVQETTVPSYDAATQKLIEEAPVHVNDQWQRVWSVVALTTEEKATVDANQAAQVRADRNSRLAECDWTQLADTPADKALWATYRQELRDVTSQAGFPWSVVWPVAPG